MTKYFSESEAIKIGKIILNDYANQTKANLDPNTQFETTVVHTSTPGVFDNDLVMTTYVKEEIPNENGTTNIRYQEIDELYLDLDMLMEGRVFTEETPENVKTTVFDYFQTNSLSEILNKTKTHNPRKLKQQNMTTE